MDTLNRMENGRHICVCGGLPDYLGAMEDTRRNLDDCITKVDRLKYLEQQEQVAAEEERERLRDIQIMEGLRREEAERRNQQLVEEAVAIAERKAREEAEERRRAENEVVLRTAAEQSIYDFNVDLFDQ